MRCIVCGRISERVDRFTRRCYGCIAFDPISVDHVALRNSALVKGRVEVARKGNARGSKVKHQMRLRKAHKDALRSQVVAGQLTLTTEPVRSGEYQRAPLEEEVDPLGVLRFSDRKTRAGSRARGFKTHTLPPKRQGRPFLGQVKKG